MKALLLLYRLQIMARVRKLVASMKTVKGMIVTLILLFCFGVMGLPSVLVAIGMERGPSFDFKPFAPFLLFAYFIFSMVTSIGDRSIYFTPSEVDQLFPAPFSRRELLGYKIISWAIAAFFMAVFFSIAFATYFHNVLFGFVGMAMTLLWLTLMDMFVTLIGQTISQQVHSLGRKIVALVLLGLLAAGMSQAFMQIEITDLNNITRWFTSVSESTFGKCVLAPFQVFTNVIFAASWLEFVLYGGISILILGAFFYGIFRLDANYLETAISVSEKVFEQVQRMQQGQMKVSVRSTGWKLPMFGFMGGFGPMAWRQFVTLIRQSRTFIVVTSVLALAFVIPVVLDFDHKFATSPIMVGVAFGMMAYISVIFSLSMSIGFRSDIDHIEVFKALPIRPFAVAAGELVGAVFLFTLMHFFLSVVGLIVLQKFAVWWLTGMAFIVPFNVLSMALSNSLFLWFPVRNMNGAKDVETIGQGFLFMFLLGLIFLGVAVIVLLPSVGVYYFTEAVVASWVIAWTMVSICAVVSVYVTGYSYTRFDVTRIPA